MNPTLNFDQELVIVQGAGIDDAFLRCRSIQNPPQISRQQYSRVPPFCFATLPWCAFGSPNLLQVGRLRSTDGAGIPHSHTRKAHERLTLRYGQIEGLRLRYTSPVFACPSIVAIARDITSLSSVLGNGHHSGAMILERPSRNIQRDSRRVQEDWYDVIMMGRRQHHNRTVGMRRGTCDRTLYLTVGPRDDGDGRPVDDPGITDP